MVNYVCSRCGYQTKMRSSFKYHLNRKYICKPKMSTVSIDTIKEFYGFEILCTRQNGSENGQTISLKTEHCICINGVGIFKMPLLKLWSLCFISLCSGTTTLSSSSSFPRHSGNPHVHGCHQNDATKNS